MKDRSNWRVYIGNIEDAPTNWDDWKDKSLEERLQTVDDIRRIHHNGKAGFIARLERTIEFVNNP